MKNKLISGFIILSSIISHAQEVDNTEEQISFFESEEKISFEDSSNQDNVEAGPNFPIDDPVPINDYLPLLAVAAVGLGFYYRKELKLKTK